jgi:hypothetical protein
MWGLTRITLVMLLIICVGSIVGCAFLNKAAPSSIDTTTGQPIPGTHEPTQQVKDIAGVIPGGWGNVALYALLLGWNGWEKYKANKVGKGLNSTLIALNQIKGDPTLQKDWEQIKGILSDAHDVAGVQPVIQQALAKIG